MSASLRIAYRESIRRRAAGERKYIRHFDGRGHFGHVRLELLPRAGKMATISSVADLSLPETAYHAARAALFRKLERGPLHGYPMIGVEVQLLGATYRELYSSAGSMAMAACMAFDDALFRAGAVLMEPWVGVHLRVESYALGETVATLTRFLGEIEGRISRGAMYYNLRLPVPCRLVRTIQNVLGLKSLEAIS